MRVGQFLPLIPSLLPRVMVIRAKSNFAEGSLKYRKIVLIFCLPSRTPGSDIKEGLVIHFIDFLSRKVKLKTTLDGVFMSIINFDWLVLNEIMASEIHKVKKEQNQKKRPFSTSNKTTTKIQ